MRSISIRGQMKLLFALLLVTIVAGASSVMAAPEKESGKVADVPEPGEQATDVKAASPEIKASSPAAGPGLGEILARSLTKFLEEKGIIAEAEEEEKDDLVELNFSGQEIDRLCKFISEITDKAVIKSDEASGKFTIINPHKVTKAKAMDLILAQLEMKGLTLIESDDLIRVVPMKSALTRDLATGVIDLGTPDFRMVREVVTLQHAVPSKLQEAIKPLLAETANVIADDRTQSLVITDTAVNIAHLVNILRALDRPDTKGEVVTDVLTLDHATAEDLSKSLSSLLEHLKAARTTEEKKKGPEEITTKIFADARTNSLIVSGVQDDVDLLRELVKELDTPGVRGFETEVFRLKSADAQQVAENIQDYLSVRKTGYAEPKVVANDWTNSVIVSCAGADMEAVGHLVKQMDIEKSLDRDIKMFILENADASLLAGTLRDLYDLRYAQVWRGGREVEDLVDVRPDQRLNALIVSAPNADFPKIEKIIKDLDQDALGDVEEPRFFRLENADAEQVAQTLNELFAETTGRRGPWYDPDRYSQRIRISGLSGKVRLIPELITNSVIVIASSPRAFEVVDGLVKKLDEDVPPLGSTTVIKLKNGIATELATVLNELFKEEEDGRRGGFFEELYGTSRRDKEISNLIGRVRIVAESRTNSLLITTSKQNLETITRLVESLDTPVSQVLIEILIVEVLLNERDELGIDWNQGRLEISTEALYEHGKELVQDAEGLLRASDRFDRYSVLTSTQFSIVLNFLSQHTLLNVLSRPNLITANNRHAQINNSIETAIPGRISETQTGTLSEIQYRDVGLILDVTPSVSASNDAVVLSILLNTGNILEDSTVQIGDVEVPQFSKRLVQTNVRVVDGQTFVLAGVITEREAGLDERVPFLGHIPILGRFFTNTRDLYDKSELITFITPYVFEEPEQLEEITRRQEERVRVFEQLRLQSQLDMNGIRKALKDASSREEFSDTLRNRAARRHQRRNY